MWSQFRPLILKERGGRGGDRGRCDGLGAGGELDLGIWGMGHVEWRCTDGGYRLRLGMYK